MNTQPEALLLAEYWETRAKDLQTWVDENDFVEFGYRPEGLKREQADQRRTAAELRRLHQSEHEGWRYADELEQERKRLHEVNQELLEALKIAVGALERSDYIQMDGDSFDAVDVSRAAITKATGERDENQEIKRHT